MGPPSQAEAIILMLAEHGAEAALHLQAHELALGLLGTAALAYHEACASSSAHKPQGMQVLMSFSNPLPAGVLIHPGQLHDSCQEAPQFLGAYATTGGRVTCVRRSQAGH